MQQSKLITILKSLDSTEFRQFYRYLQAPLLTKSRDVLNLYDVIRKHYPTFDSTKLDRQKVFKKLYPKKAFDGNRFSILLFKLTKILDEYLIFLKFQQDEFQKKKLLTQIYGERNLNVIFKKNTEELLIELDKQPYRDSLYFYDRYFLQQDYYFHVNTNKQGGIVEILKKALLSLEYFFNIERLRLGLDLKNRTHIYAECHEFTVANIHFPENNILYQLLKKSIFLFEKQEEETFLEVKKLLVKQMDRLSPTDKIYIFQLLLNYTIQQLPKNEEKYLPAALDFYKIGLNTKILYANGLLTNSVFLNIVSAAAKLQEFDFAINFLEQNKNSINASTSQEMIQLAKSTIYFFQKDYDNVLVLLQQYSFTNIIHKFAAKVLLIRTYYHISENNPTYQQLVIHNCETFEKLLRREERINLIKKKAFMNFIYLLKKIIKFQTNFKKNNTSKSSLMDLLNNTSHIVSRNWIKTVIEKL